LPRLQAKPLTVILGSVALISLLLDEFDDETEEDDDGDDPEDELTLDQVDLDDNELKEDSLMGLCGRSRHHLFVSVMPIFLCCSHRGDRGCPCVAARMVVDPENWRRAPPCVCGASDTPRPRYEP